MIKKEQPERRRHPRQRITPALYRAGWSEAAIRRQVAFTAGRIIGRGARVHEDTRKYYFALIAFGKATNHFAGTDFDGDPVQIYAPGEGEPLVPPDLPADGADADAVEPGAAGDALADG